MKLQLVDDDGSVLGEASFTRKGFETLSIVSLARLVEDRARKVVLNEKAEHSVESIITPEALGLLESLDDDASIMAVPLRLADACKLDIEKHVVAIASDEASASESRKRPASFDQAQEQLRSYDHRYKEKPGNRIKFR